ncbi:Major facilitator superfamily domain general substrate transporter [Penicillium cf. griseofulvum]|nr:Major facilitator superfamily domain general substrate transporter [Penicillium cf. griseofulvum]
MFWMMIIARGIAGFRRWRGSIPVCATSATEAPPTRQSISVSDVGFVAAGLVALIVLACYSQQNSEGVWRLTFGFGYCVAIIHMLLRVQMVNSTQYRKHAIKRRSIPTALAWFCYDFVTHTPFGLFSSTIIDS